MHSRTRRRFASPASLLAVVAAALVVAASGSAGSSPVNISNYTDATINLPTEITAGPDGALWYTNRGGFSIGRITTAGVVDSYSTPVEAGYLYGITLGPDNALWFTSDFAIGRITASGSVSTYSGGPGGFGFPLGITAGPDGALWFTEPGLDKIGRIDTSGVITNVYTDASISQPFGITAGPDEALWFTNRGNNTIGRIDTDGSVSSYSSPSISTPMTITAGPDGALWFTNWGNSSIGRITTDGAVTAFTEATIFSPFGIATGPDGALWFTDQGNVSIGRITTAGVVTNFSDTSIQPWGITAGFDGAVWFTNFGFNSIGRIAPITPPTLSVPQDISVNATGPSGSVVTYTVTATDDTDPSPTVTCTPESGSLFPINPLGESTEVVCTASDAVGNTATTSFMVRVKGASEQVEDLTALVDSYQLGKLRASLHDKLVTVQRFLAAGKPRQAEENLAAFMAQVNAQAGKGLTQERADALTGAAQRIMDVIET